MKRTITQEYNELEEKLAASVAAMNFRFMNLCVKAEEMSLIPIRARVEGSNQNLENVAMIGKKDDYSFMIVPNSQDDMKAIALGISIVHPDFKQKEETLSVEAYDGGGNPVVQEVPYIMVTMPEVDGERYDILKQGVDAFYQECKIQMEKALAQSTARISFEGIGEPPEDIEKMLEAVDKLKTNKEELREKLKMEKLLEIEDGHRKWLAENGKDPDGNTNDEGRDVSMSMRFDTAYES